MVQKRAEQKHSKCPIKFYTTEFWWFGCFPLSQSHGFKFLLLLLTINLQEKYNVFRMTNFSSISFIICVIPVSEKNFYNIWLKVWEMRLVALYTQTGQKRRVNRKDRDRPFLKGMQQHAQLRKISFKDRWRWDVKATRSMHKHSAGTQY